MIIMKPHTVLKKADLRFLCFKRITNFSKMNILLAIRPVTVYNLPPGCGNLAPIMTDSSIQFNHYMEQLGSLDKREFDIMSYWCRLMCDKTEGLYFIVRPLSETVDRTVCFRHVVWVEANGNYSHIHLINGTYISVSLNLDQVERVLNASPDNAFIRINRSTIISLRWLDRREANLLYLVTHRTPFTVSTEYRKQFKDRLESFPTLKKNT